MVYRLVDPLANPQRLSQSVLQATQMLAMYQAELARLLGLQCADIGELAAGRRVLQPQTAAWQQAEYFIRLYQALFDYCAGDGVAMCHWLRRHNPALQGVPLLLMVDEGHLARVYAYLEADAAK